MSKSFLKIVYGARGGTGIHISKTLILTVNNQKLRQSLHITSLFNEEFIDFSKPVDQLKPVDIKSVYELNFALAGDNTRNYKLNIKIHDEKQSKQNPRTNYSHNKEAVLIFDLNQCIFYNEHKAVSRYFIVFDPKTQNETRQYISGTFPVVKLYKSEYYYIKGEWYEKNDNNLSKYSYR
ncbi:MAG TPA: hypothetical protein VK668_16930 [Mucilaginibacter sp.]|nr:hypothetical protein [Mucilaginibacter sp.]